MSTAEPLPKYEFHGQQLPAEVEAFADNYLKTRVIELPPELPQSPEFQTRALAMEQCIVRYGADRNIDLSGRVPQLNRVHIFDNRGMERLHAMYPEILPYGLGGILGGSDLFLKQLPPGLSRGFLQNAGHELMHMASANDQYVVQNPDRSWTVQELRSGFHAETGIFAGWNEYWTQRANQQVIDTYWQTHPKLRDFAEFQATTPTNAPPDERYDTLYQFGINTERYIAEHGGQDILTEMEAAYFTGDSRPFHDLGELFGSDFVDTLAGLRTHAPAAVVQTAQKLGIPL